MKEKGDFVLKKEEKKIDKNVNLLRMILVG